MRMLQEDWNKEYCYAGGFQTALMKTIEKADNINLQRIELGFPEIIEAYRKHIAIDVNRRINNG